MAERLPGEISAIQDYVGRMTAEQLLIQFFKHRDIPVSISTESVLRIVSLYREFFLDPGAAYHRTFEFTTIDAEGAQGMVVTSAIPFYSFCEHHMIPFFGHVYVGYVPSEVLAGFSKIPRTVDWFARRPQLQERMTQQIAGFLKTHIKPKGLGVIIRAQHLCVAMRGIEKPGVIHTTASYRGDFLVSSQVREEFWMMSGLNGG